jgi:hypothetical protein
MEKSRRKSMKIQKISKGHFVVSLLLVLVLLTSTLAACGGGAVSAEELADFNQKMFDAYVDNFTWQLATVENRAAADAVRVSRGVAVSALPFLGEQLKNLTDASIPYTEVYYAFETDGKYIGTSDTADMSVDYRTRPWYVGAKAAGGIFVSAPYTTVTNETGEYIITFSYPITQNGAFQGVVGIDMNAAELQKRLLPKDIAPFIAGIVLKGTDGTVYPFFNADYSAHLASSSKYSATIDSMGGNWQLNVYGNFDDVNKTLKKMTREQLLQQYDKYIVDQLLFQLNGSLDYVSANVARNARISSSVSATAEFNSTRAKNVAVNVNNEFWQYDDVYYVFESDGKYVGTDESVSASIDFRARPWYVAAKAADGVVRTDFYQSITGSRQKIMTFACPFTDANGIFLGAVGFDITTQTAKSMLYTGDSSLLALLLMVE